MKASAVKKYQFEFKQHELPDRLATDSEVNDVLDGSGETSPSEHIVALIAQERDQFPELDFEKALARVQTRNPALFRLYASESAGCLRVY